MNVLELINQLEYYDDTAHICIKTSPPPTLAGWDGPRIHEIQIIDDEYGINALLLTAGAECFP